MIEGIVSSMCDAFHIPHFTTNWMISEETMFETHKFTRNFFPESNVYSRALAEIVVNFGWSSFTVLYDSNDGKCVLHAMTEDLLNWFSILMVEHRSYEIAGHFTNQWS